MFEIIVRGLDEADREIASGWPTRIVSVVSPHIAKELTHHGDHHCIVAMEDVALAHYNAAPTLADISTILDFTQGLAGSDRLLVHCHYGQSRSSAVAIGVLVQHGMAPEDAFEKVITDREIALPNMLICQHLDTIFRLDGVLAKRNSRHLLDYLDNRPFRA